jgi:4-hydroxybenzoate polyprenyltransferase
MTTTTLLIPTLPAAETRAQCLSTPLSSLAALMLWLGRLGVLLPLGGACAVAAVSQAVTGTVSLPLVTVVFLCIYSSYLIDHLAEVEQFDDALASARSRLLAKKRLFATAGALVYFTALVLAGFHAGAASVIGLLVFPLSVLFYALPLLRVLSGGRCRFASVKDIPGVKSVYTAVFWGWLMVYACDFLNAGTFAQRSCLALCMTLSLFVNTVLCDFKDLARDRAAGVRTLPVMLGSERTLRLLSVVNVLAVLLPLLFAIAGMVPASLMGIAITNLVFARFIHRSAVSVRARGWIGEAGADAAFILWLPGALVAARLLEIML